jgi:alkanesulfonate monooxygenase SsuD/methylene tetrahydromethanopterin reductase-like flavin-dependent oxidoreductase (luciferase family)
MAIVAAITARIRLLTSVMVVPYREPVLTAKMVATIDHLSGGRVVLGCGSGWMPEEFEALGAPPYRERGSVTDEYIDIYRDVVDPKGAGLRRQVSTLLEYPLRTQTRTTPPPANLDRG